MTSVALHEIVFDETIYPRAAWSKSTVDRYADAMNSGDHFPPLILEAGTNRLLDGKHRTEAYRAIGRPLVAVEYRDIPDGVPPRLYAASLSSRHGDPLAGKDKREVARAVAETNPDFSMVLIAKMLGTSRQTVSNYIGDLVEHRREVRRAQATLLTRAGLSNRKAAEELGVDESVVRADVKGDILPQLSESLLREAAADLPIDAEPIVEEILAERTVPMTPEPAEPPSTAPTGSGPDPVAGRKATILRVLADAGSEGLTQAEIAEGSDDWPGGVIFAGHLLTAVAELADAGQVARIGMRPQGAAIWALTSALDEPKPEPAPAPTETAEGRALKEDLARESERRAAIQSIRSVLTYLTSRVLEPEVLAGQYDMALDEFTAEELLFAAKTMAAIAARKAQ